MDIERMSVGLIDYNICFFNSESAVKLKIEEHYALWQETMFAHFGCKWVLLNHGPMWQYDEDEDLKENENVPRADILAKVINSAKILDVGNVLAVDSAELGQVVACDEVEGFDTGSVAQCVKCSEVLLNNVAEAGVECEGSASISTLWTREDQVVANGAIEGCDTGSLVQSVECCEVLSNDVVC